MGRRPDRSDGTDKVLGVLPPPDAATGWATTMTIVTEVRFTHEDGALADTLDALPDLDVAVTREVGTDPGQRVDILRFEDDRDELETVLEGDHTVREAAPMPGNGPGPMLGIEWETGTKLLAPEVTDRDGFVLEARSTTTESGARGWHERWLLPDGDALHDIWQHAREEGFEFEVLEYREQGRGDPEFPGPDALTDQQREALVLALERGYFTEPRETSLEELADSIGISATAFGGRLRRGMRALIGMTLVAEEPPR